MNQNTHINHIMQNYPLESYSVTEANVMKGGEKTKDTPTGGFPPIYAISGDKDLTDNELFANNDKKKREYEKNKTAVSIKDIIEKRRNLQPFIATAGTYLPAPDDSSESSLSH